MTSRRLSSELKSSRSLELSLVPLMKLVGNVYPRFAILVNNCQIATVVHQATVPSRPEYGNTRLRCLFVDDVGRCCGSWYVLW